MKEFGKSKWIAAALAVTAGTGVLFGAEVLKIEKASDLLGTRNLTENAAEKSITASGRYARVTSKITFALTVTVTQFFQVLI